MCLIFFSVNAQLNFEWVNRVGEVNTNTSTRTLHFDGTDILHSGTVSSSAFGGGYIYKFNTSGDTLWFKGVLGTSAQNSIEQIATDGLGNVYAVGYFFGSVDLDPGFGTLTVNSNCCVYTDLFILKLNSSGNLIWAKTIQSSLFEGISSLIVEDNGSFYLGGGFTGTMDLNPGAAVFNVVSNGTIDNYIAKYDSTGNFIWGKSFGGPGNDDLKSLKLNSSNNLVATGYYNNTVDFDPDAGTLNLTSNGSSDIFIISVDSFGTLLWAKSIGGNSSDVGIDLTFDNSNNIYISGTYRDTIDLNPGTGINEYITNGSKDIFILKLDMNGTYNSSAAFGSSNPDEINSIESQNNKLYLGGSFNTEIDFDPGIGIFNITPTSSNFDVFVSCLDTSMNFNWASKIGGSSFENLSDLKIVSDSIYLTGIFNNTSSFDPLSGAQQLTALGNPDGFVLKLSVCTPNGITLDNISLADLTSECEITQPNAPTATNSCGTVLTGTTTTVFPLTAAGNTVITWNYNDGNGNTVSQTQNAVITNIDSTTSLSSTTISAIVAGYNYQWLDCLNGNSPINGQNSQSFTPTVNGTYAVQISNNNGCTVLSDCIQVTVTSINSILNNSNPSFYPNPTNSFVHIDLKEMNEAIISLMDINGKKLTNFNTSISKNSIDLSIYPLGLYFINIYTKEKQFVYKILKQ
jgi:hypothetical protein